VPEGERWDVVVCNPPQLLPRVLTDTDTAVTFDPEWRLHRNFYSNLKRFTKPGGHAIVLGARYETSGKTFESMISAGGGKLVIESDGELLGFIAVRVIHPEWEIENIVVAEDRKRHGLGSQLLRALIERARSKSAKSILLEVRESNHAAISLYQKHGFLQDGR